MLPLSLDVTALPVVLVGRGEPVLKRLALLDEAGAGALTVFSDDPLLADDRVRRRLPTADDLAGARLVMIAGLDDDASTALADLARRAGALVNVEDRTALCDVQMPAVVRRGALTVAIATGGRSPGLARLLKSVAERLIDTRWARWLDELAGQRARWRAAGLGMAEVSRRSAAYVRAQGWLRRAETVAASAPPQLPGIVPFGRPKQ